MLHDPQTGLNTVAAKLDALPARRGGRPEHRDRPELQVRTSGSTSTTRRRRNTPVDVPATTDVNEGDAPFNRHARRDFALVQGRRAAVALQVARRARSTCRPSSRSSTCRSTAASAATSAATSTSTGRATCTCRPATTRTRSSREGYTPIDERPSRNPAFDAQRSAANTNDLRGKILRISPKAGGGYELPAGNLFPQGAAEDEARDLPDGPAQPVPHGGRPGNRTTCTSATTRRTPTRPTPTRGPAGIGRWMSWTAGRATTAGLLHDPTSRLRGLRLRHRGVRARSSSARTRSTSRRTTPAGGPAARDRQPDVWYTLSATSAGVPGARHAAASARWAARRTTSSRTPARGPSGRSARRPAAVLRVDARLLQGLRAQRRRATGLDIQTCSWPRSRSDNPMDIEFGAGRRAVHARVRRRVLPRDLRRRSSAASTSCAATSHADRKVTADKTELADRAADGELLERRDERPGRRHLSRTQWDFDADGTVDSTPGRTRRSRTPSAASTTPR